MPYCVFLILLFWNVLLLLPVPRLETLIPVVALPEPIPNKVCVLPLPTMFRFLTTLLVAASAVLVVCSQITALLALVLALVIVRSRDDVPLLEPSIVT